MPSPTTITLYSRPECHLCDEARAGLEALRGEGLRFELREVDIDSDETLLRSHLERIPVIEVNGSVVCELGLDAGAVKAVLGTVRA
jgi:glutaredoxin